MKYSAVVGIVDYITAMCRGNFLNPLVLKLVWATLIFF